MTVSQMRKRPPGPGVHDQLQSLVLEGGQFLTPPVNGDHPAAFGASDDPLATPADVEDQPVGAGEVV